MMLLLSSRLRRRSVGYITHSRSLRILLPRTISRFSSTEAETTDNLREQRVQLTEDARRLTLRLYRSVIRSVRLIRHGNEHDEIEFQRREREREERLSQQMDPRLGMMSMLPAVDRTDELRSRAEYYLQYASESFLQESDCLDAEEWEEAHVRRYLYHLRHGEKHRQWLLSDMKFADRYSSSFDHVAVDVFEQRAMQYVEQSEDAKAKRTMSSDEYQRFRKYKDGMQNPQDTEEEDPFTDDEEEEDDTRRGLPSWYKNPR